MRLWSSEFDLELGPKRARRKTMGREVRGPYNNDRPPWRDGEARGSQRVSRGRKGGGKREGTRASGAKRMVWWRGERSRPSDEGKEGERLNRGRLARGFGRLAR